MTLVLALAFGLALPSPASADARVIAPDLDAGRVCYEDAQWDCAWSEGERVFRERPEDPAVHLFLAALAAQEQLDVDEVSREYLDAGEAFATWPSAVELQRLAWESASFAERLVNARPGDDLAAERARLSKAIEDLEPFDEEERLLRAILAVGLSRADIDDPRPAPAWALEDLAESDDPSALMTLVKALPFASDEQRIVLWKLLDTYPENPRYPSWLLYQAGISEHRLDELRALARSWVPGTAWDDNLLELVVASEGSRPIANEGLYREMEYLVTTDRRHDTTEHVAVMLAESDAAEGNHARARQWLDLYEQRFGPPVHDFGTLRARLLAKDGLHADAANAELAAIRRGGTDYGRWLNVARNVQRAGNDDEAVRLYQFYLVQLQNRADGTLAIGPPAGLKELARGEAIVWSHFVEIRPVFFAKAALAQLLELLALTAAGILAAARLPRARAFVLPGALAGEIAFFAGLLLLRLDGKGEIGLGQWLWLFSAAARVFLLVGGGLYLSAVAGLPRHGRLSAATTLAACAGALVLGVFAGGPPAPRYVVEGMPVIARLGELAVFPAGLREAPALFVSVLRQDAALFLVWPALAFSALGASARRPRPALVVAIAAAAAFAASASPFHAAAALAGAAVLVAARVRFGALLPFLLHGAFAAGALAAHGALG